jgi:multidrug efflux system membrane fusion protein
MASRFKAHRFSAILVLIAAGLWVGTGKFASVGSEEAHAAQPAPGEKDGDAAASAVAPATPMRTVAAIEPVFAEHARGIRMSGATEADKRAVLAARAGGVIRTLPIKQGDEVAADQPVMVIEGPEIIAGIATAKATLAQRQQEFAAAEKLFKSGNTAELQLIAQRAELAAAEAQVSQAEADADRLTLRAPFAGTVDSVAVEIGEWVQTGTPIATLLSLDPIVVRAEVSEIDVGYVEVGDKASVRLVSGATFEGTVRHLSREASEGTRTYPIEIALPNPDHVIPAGMTTEVNLFAEPVRAVVVPRSIITLSAQGELGLRIVDKDDVAHFASVELIDDTPGGLVLAGVPADARIIVAGQDLVRDGEKVIVTEGAIEAAAGAAQ